MGVSYSGKFTQIIGVQNPPPAPPSNLFMDLPLTSTQAPSGFSLTTGGTPEFVTAPNANNAGGRQVAKFVRGQGDYVKVTGPTNANFLKADFSVSFWVNIPEFGGQNGDIVFTLGTASRVFLRFRTTSVGNGLANCESVYLDGAGQIATSVVSLDVGQWNNVTITKHANLPVTQLYTGTRVTLNANGYAGAGNSVFTRSNGDLGTRNTAYDTDVADYPTNTLHYNNPLELYIGHPTAAYPNMHVGGFRLTTVDPIWNQDGTEKTYQPNDWNVFQ